MKVLLDIIFAVIENTLIVMYLNLFLKKKRKYEDKLFLDVGFIIVLTIALLLVNHFIKTTMNGIVLIIMLIAYTHLIYDGNLYNKILKIILININMIIIGGVCSILFTSTSFYRFIYDDSYIYYHIAVFMKFIWLVEYFYLKKYYTGEFKLSKKVWAYIVLVLLLIMGLVVVVSNELLLNHISLMTALYTYIVSLLVVILIYYVCLKMTEYYNEVIDQKVNLESLKYESTIVKVATQKSEEYNKILHDYKHLIGILKGMKLNEEVKKDILADVDLKETKELIHTNNAVFNFAMNQSMDKAFELGIDFHGTYPQHISKSIMGYDLLMLLTNLFDNAIEMSQNADKKDIKYNIVCNDYNFIMKIESSCCKEYFDDLVNRKDIKIKYKQRLNKIKEIVEKYNGEDILQKNENSVLHSCLINLPKE